MSVIRPAIAAPPSLRVRSAAEPGARAAAEGALRLQIAAVVVALIWLGSLVFQLVSGPESTLPSAVDAYWVGLGVGVSNIAIAFIVGLVARRRARIGRNVGTLSLVFGVLSTFLVSLSENQGTDWLIGSRGIPFASLWVLFFPLIVPTRPSRAAIAIAFGAATTPAAVALWSLTGAPWPTLGEFIAWWLPVIAAAGMALVPVVVLYRAEERASAAQAEARRLGSYQLTRRIASGGMGEVWRARHDLLARAAAVKIIRPERLGTASDAALMRQRFEREAQVTAALRSAHTVEIFDYGVATDGSLYSVMELLEGIDLESLVARFGPQPPERAVHLALQACDSLAEAHAEGLVHRDIKPANLHVGCYGTRCDVLKVLDFGLVLERALGGADPISSRRLVVGTPAFIAPEGAASADAIDGRADLYSLGCVIWWLVTGRLVFDGDDPLEQLMARLERQPPWERLAAGEEVAVPAALITVLERCLARDPAERYANAEALAADLERVAASAPWTRELASRWWAQHLPSISTHTDGAPARNPALADTL